MNKSIGIILLATLLLGGCEKPVDKPAATAVTSGAADGASDEVVSVPTPTASAIDSVPVETSGVDITPAIDDYTAINASIDRLLGDHVKYQAVIEAYQQAVTRGDKAAVAALVAYPFKADFGGNKTTIKDPQVFQRDYDRIITPAIARAIQAQKYPELMVNGKGVMFGSGQTWINGVCKEGSADCSEFEVKVVAIQAGASN